jgi:serine/threonine protein kinase
VILNRFDQAWGAGAAPEIRDYLPADSGDSRVSPREVLIELVMIDLERRWRTGASEAATVPVDTEQFPAKPVLEDYVARHPELGAADTLPVELICEEFRVRSRWGDRPDREEYLRRFPAQAAKLQSALAKTEVSIDATIDMEPASGGASYEQLTLPAKSLGSAPATSTGDRVRYFGEYELLDEIGEYQGQHYFSMGFVEAESLADRVKDGPLPPQEAAEIVKKVAEAVAYAHIKGVTHRDLKPANVLLDANGEPRVTDFGLAKQVRSDRDLTRTGAVIGTPSYMPPEQASGKIDEVGP